MHQGGAAAVRTRAHAPPSGPIAPLPSGTVRGRVRPTQIVEEPYAVALLMG